MGLFFQKTLFFLKSGCFRTEKVIVSENECFFGRIVTASGTWQEGVLGSEGL